MSHLLIQQKLMFLSLLYREKMNHCFIHPHCEENLSGNKETSGDKQYLKQKHLI